MNSECIPFQPKGFSSPKICDIWRVRLSMRSPTLAQAWGNLRHRNQPGRNLSWSHFLTTFPTVSPPHPAGLCVSYTCRETKSTNFSVYNRQNMSAYIQTCDVARSQPEHNGFFGQWLASIVRQITDVHSDHLERMLCFGTSDFSKNNCSRS